MPAPDGVRLLRLALPFLLVAAITGVVLRALTVNAAPSGQAAEGRLESAEVQREAVAARAATVAARAGEMRAAAKPAIARAESLQRQVEVAGRGELRVQTGGESEATIVPVPPLVTERIQADSAAISALSVALMWDDSAAAAQENRLAVQAQVNEAARVTIAALEHERRPRCGLRCGMVLGAASVVALGLVVR